VLKRRPPLERLPTAAVVASADETVSATCARHDRRPGGGRTVALWPGSSSSPSLAWLEDASSAQLEDAPLPRMLEEEVGHRPTRRQAPTRCAPLPSPDDEYP
jgi:hypothetical protein